ncbi:hypothetical protein LAV72_04125 [Lysinibacillus xylanilyticus]|uniref:hypothetical protein n=1 Tax=Lysinibacillus xylanilyticus TaxID=582475 RepID=UPI002B24B097|nr:hypothetical protein [Lysinibacillus xylanilyticus]MEB2298813.1 hypothetical protein [Lysinibacillus xylanilyticus]
MMNPKIRNENSPLEELMEAALNEANIKFRAQYTVYDGNNDKWNAKYTLDFLVYGEFCKIAWNVTEIPITILRKQEKGI